MRLAAMEGLGSRLRELFAGEIHQTLFKAEEKEVNFVIVFFFSFPDFSLLRFLL